MFGRRAMPPDRTFLQGQIIRRGEARHGDADLVVDDVNADGSESGRRAHYLGVLSKRLELMALRFLFDFGDGVA